MVAEPLAAPGGGAPARSLYRSLLRTARRMPDDHRTAFVVHRVRSVSPSFAVSRCLVWRCNRVLTLSFPLDADPNLRNRERWRSKRP